MAFDHPFDPARLGCDGRYRLSLFFGDWPIVEGPASAGLLTPAKHSAWNIAGAFVFDGPELTRPNFISAWTLADMGRRAISELIGETETRLNDSRSRVQEERKVIARRKAIGAELTESQELLENLETRVMLIDGRLRYLRLVHRLRLDQLLR